MAVTTKTCLKCGATKPASEFRAARRHRNGQEYIYIAPRCRSCHADEQRQRRADNPQKALDIHLRYFHGITAEVYQGMFARQQGCCAICVQPQGKRRLSVDHDHKTGKIRGLLCHRCNVALGFLEDRGPSDLFWAARQYLLAHAFGFPSGMKLA